MRKKMNLNDFSKWLQYNKEWKIEGGLNTFRTHCIYIYIYIYMYVYIYTYISILSSVYCIWSWEQQYFASPEEALAAQELQVLTS